MSSFDEDALAEDYLKVLGKIHEFELYGDLGREPHYLAELMISRDPDEFIKNKVLLCLEPICSPNSIKMKCPGNMIYHEESDLCYSDGVPSVASDARDNCQQILAEAFTPTSDEQLKKLANFIKQGKLKSIREGIEFWTSNTKDQTGLLVQVDGTELDGTSFSMLDIEHSNAAKDRCLSVEYSAAQQKFLGKETSCSDILTVLCFSLPLNASFCEFSPHSEIPEEEPGDEPRNNMKGQPGGGSDNSDGQPRVKRQEEEQQPDEHSGDSLDEPNEHDESGEHSRNSHDEPDEHGPENPVSAGEHLSRILNFNERLKVYQKMQAEVEGMKDYFSRIDWKKSYKLFFELLWSLKLPCFDTDRFSGYPTHRSMLKMCIWKGTKLPCSSIFTTFPTEAGMCCTFNLQQANEMLRESKFVNVIDELQERDKEESFEETTEPEWFTSNQEPFPEQGVKNGLTVMLDAHTDKLQDSSVDEDFQGFLAAITPPTNYPLIDLNSIMLRPGHVNNVAITATEVVATNSFKDSLSLDQRHCYYSDEYKLETYHEYSHPACLLECQMKLVKDLTGKTSKEEGCYPWFLPHAEINTTVCDPWSARHFLANMKKLPDTCKDCLVDCEYTEYSAAVTAVPFRVCDNKNLGVSRLCNIENPFGPNPGIYGTQIFDEYDYQLPSFANRFVTSRRQRAVRMNDEMFSVTFNKDKFNLYDAYEKDIAMVNFYFPSAKAVRFTRQPAMTEIEFLSQIGGLLGLCIGFSFCSLVEILYWFGIRIWKSPKYKNN